jgi:hypothetical protein
MREAHQDDVICPEATVDTMTIECSNKNELTHEARA